MRGRRGLTRMLRIDSSLIVQALPSGVGVPRLVGLAREVEATATGPLSLHDGQAALIHDALQARPHRCSCWTHRKSRPVAHSGATLPTRKEGSTPRARLLSVVSPCRANSRGTASPRPRALQGRYTCALRHRCRGITTATTIIIGARARGLRPPHV